jgi:hypothetical protein
MSTPRDHHFIPIFYLKRWTGINGKLIEYSRPYKNKISIKAVGPASTCYQTDLYSILNCPPEIAHFLESQFLTRTDHLASLVLDKLLSGAQITWTPELRSAWSRFTFNFMIRHPHPFDEIKTITLERMLTPDNITKSEYERLRQPNDPATFEEFVISRGNNLAHRIHIRFLQGILDNRGLGTRLNAMLWNVLDLSKSPNRLLTSDWPLFKDINEDRAIFAFLISPTALFTAVSHVDIFHDLRNIAAKELVRQINTYVVSSARIYVYGSDQSQNVFVQNRMSSKMVDPPFFPTLQRGVAL